MHSLKGGSACGAHSEPDLALDWLSRATGWATSPALISAQGELSYAELANEVAARRQQLIAAGLQGGDRLAIAASRERETLLWILAAVAAGVAYVPLDLGYPDERLRMMLEDSQPRAVVGSAVALAELAQRLGPLPDLNQPAARRALHAAEADLAYVLFTSGSTGRPKGVAMGRGPLSRLIDWHVQHPRLGQSARCLLFAPFSFDVHFQEIFSTLAVGGCLILTDEATRRDPLALAEVIEEKAVERLFLPYVALQMLAEACAERAPACLRDVISAGEQLQISASIRRLFAALPQAALHNHYGPTESHVVTAFELLAPAHDWPAIPPIGPALPYVEIRLQPLDDADGANEGELLLGGPTLAHGYLGRAELSAERFVKDDDGQIWYHTGDRVRIDAAGGLSYLGRADRQVKIDGFRIEPGEIELALLEQPGLKDAAVAPRELPGLGLQLVAWVVADGASETSGLEQALRGAMRQRLPAYMQPLRYVQLERLPQTPSGKIDRAALQLDEAAQQTTSTHLEPAEAIGHYWRQLLASPELGDQDNLFEAGARSLTVLRFLAMMRELGGSRLNVADVYDHPSIAGLRRRLQQDGASGRQPTRQRQRQGGQGQNGAIAIIGMALDTALGQTVEQFWQALLDGAEGIRQFRPEELDPDQPAEIRQHPHFVPARGVLADPDQFDAEFFGIPAREAVLIDPQQRRLLQLAWNALEDAGLRPDGEHSIGVYAGSANNTYATALRRHAPQLIAQSGEFSAMLASEKDYVATRIAHRLDLHGPALSIHTACSTGLVAIAQACEALRAGQCDIALAGGATLTVPQASGYVHVEGGMESADGHCRPFDAAASGTVFASGAALVVLKPLERAMEDHDHIHAVIHGVGLNNDGGGKASFTAPSQSGQAEVIRMALDDAGLSAAQIGYVEAHGTATQLGDPIELAALSQAFRQDTEASGYCRIGSLKSNLGHTVAAAGALGLIKSALALQHQRIPATLHFHAANPLLDLEASPFRVCAELQAWPRSETPRYAGVSSFGVGGTNAHLIVGEPPELARLGRLAGDQAPTLLCLSARSKDGLQRRATQLADWCAAQPDVEPASLAYSLWVGRQAMAWRSSIAVEPGQNLADALRGKLAEIQAQPQTRQVWLLPGQGVQCPGMAADLYQRLPAFAEALDQALACITPCLEVDLKPWLLEAEHPEAGRLQETRYAQPALFATCYALARWLQSLGLQPDALIGHSIGELAAACLGEVMSLADAARLVCARGAAMWTQPRGAMLAVRASADALSQLPVKIEIAAHNAPELTVLAGPQAEIDACKAELEAKGLGVSTLKVSHAFHSAAMDGALEAVRLAASRISLQAPKTPLYSCLSGKLLTAEQACSPDYWAQQVRAPVQFSAAILAELDQPHTLFVEVGPGQALSALLRRHRSGTHTAPRLVPLQGAAGEAGNAALAVQAIGQLWSHGAEPALPLQAGRRLRLPGYPFADTRYWFPRQSGAVAEQASAAAATLSVSPQAAPSAPPILQETPVSDRRPALKAELRRIMADLSGLPDAELQDEIPLVELGLDSLSLTQASQELERVFGLKLRFRRLMEDLDSIGKLSEWLHQELPAERFQPAPATAPAQVAGAPTVAPVGMPISMPILQNMPTIDASPLSQLIQQQMSLMQQQLTLLAGAQAAQMPALPAVAASTTPAAAVAPSATAPSASNEAETKADLREQPFGASARITLKKQSGYSSEQTAWLENFSQRYLAKLSKSRQFAQQHRALMADPRVVTGFNPQWKDLVFPIVAERSDGARVFDIDGHEYIDLLSCFGANLLGYQPKAVVQAMHRQLDLGIEVGPSHPLAATVSQLLSEFTGHPRIAFCNTGSEAVMGAMRIARTVTGRKTIAIFTNSYHGIFDEVIVRGTRQLRSLSAAPGILASAVENVLVLDYASEDALKVLRERGHELAAIMIEPVQNKYPTLQPRDFVHELRKICDQAGCALIFDEVVTGFRLAPGGAQEFYGVRADICTYGKIIGGGLPLAAIGGQAHWLDALDGGFWQYGDDSYPEAGVTYFAGTFVRHPLALAAAEATLNLLKQQGPAFYTVLNQRTQALVDRLNQWFRQQGAPVKAVHCASLWRLQWDEGVSHISLFYYLARFHGLHLYEQFGHFVTAAMGAAELDRIFQVFTDSLSELMQLGLIQRKPGSPDDPSPLDTGPGRSEHADQGPLSPGQEERWLAASYDADALRALNESFVLELHGALDPAAMQRALNMMIQRHPVFRLQLSGEAPEQQRFGQLEFPLHQVDLSQQPDPLQALNTYVDQHNDAAFALGQGPLLRLAWLTLGPQHHALHLVASHLVFDGWAASVFLRELAELYGAECQGRQASLPPAGDPIAFAAAEQARMQGSEASEAREFWRGQLQAPPAPLNLGDLQPEGRRSFRAGTAYWSLAAEPLAKLRAQAKAERCTLFQSALAAVASALAKLADQQDLVICVPYASQSLGQHPALIADGVLDLPLRLDCHSQHSRSELRQQVRSRLMDALEQPLMTQGIAARTLGLPSRGDRPPLTGVYFNLNPKIELGGFAPLQASMREGRKPGLLGELMFSFYDQGDTLALDLHYSRDFFSEQRIDEILRIVAAALGGTVDADPDHRVPVGRTVADDPHAVHGRARALETAPRVEQEIAAQAARSPDALAVVCGDQRLSYAQLQQRANQIARCLVKRGVQPGQRVGLCLPRSANLLAAVLGVLQTGAAYVPLDPMFPIGRLRDMLEDAELSLLLGDQAAAERLQPGDLPTVLLDRDQVEIDATVAEPLNLQFDRDLPAYVIYTSGSTGKPKGVVVMQRGVVNFLRSMADEPGLACTDHLLAVTTLSFDIAVLELMLPLCVGAQVVIALREQAVDGHALKQLIEQQQITLLQATPSTWHLLLEAGFRAPASFRALCGGEAMTPSLAQSLLGAGVSELWNMYGPTETTIWSTLSRITDPQAIHIGHPIDNTVVRILDEQGRPCAPGSAGEICIGGDGVAQGYFRREQLTAERFVADRFAETAGARIYRTGDLGSWNADGTLRHMGRLDHQVKLRGYRIELGEIEVALEALQPVQRAAVTVQNFGPQDDRLVAHLVANSTTCSLAELRRALSGRLPDYMLPQQVEWLEALPLLPNGKIDRKQLGQPAATPGTQAAAVELTPPASQSVDQVAASMAALLHCDRVEADANFFELGGHSLLAAKLTAALNKQFGSKLVLRDVFEAPTPAGLAARLAPVATASESPADWPLLQPQAKQDRAPLSSVQRRLWFLEQLTGDGGFNLLPSAHLLRGPLDPSALGRALQAFVDRHPALRTVFAPTADGAEQRVLAHLPFKLDVHDCGSTDSELAKAEIRQAVQAMLDQGVDLQRGPAFRCALYRIDPQQHVLVFIVHHLIWDGWCFDLLYRDLSELYQSELEGRSPQLPPLSISYADFCHWQAEATRSPRMQQEIGYWTQHLQPLPPALSLPSQHNRPAQWSGRGQSFKLEVDASQVQHLHALARSQGSTLFVVCLAAYAWLLHQLSQQREVLVGIPLRGREAPELLPVLGFFVNAIPFRSRLDSHDSLSLAEWIREVHREVMQDLAHPNVPLESLVQALKPKRDASRPMLFQSQFSFQDARERPADWGNLKHSRFDVPISGSSHELSLWCVELADRMETVFTYASDLFDETQARAWADQYVRILQAFAAASADQALSTIGATQPLAVLRRAEAAAPATVAALAQQSSDMLSVVRQVWCELLSLDAIHASDNFFDIGGHSLLAMRMFHELNQRTGVNLPLATLFSAPTLAELAQAFDQARGAGQREPTSTPIEAIDPWSVLVPINRDGGRRPLFFVHAVGGNVLNYRGLAEALGKDQPSYGLQSIGLDGQTAPLQRIEDMAARYIEAMRTVQPQGPYQLAGGSMGGAIAFEIARQLTAQGEQVSLLALFDTFAPASGPISGQAGAGLWRRISRSLQRGQGLAAAGRLMQRWAHDAQAMWCRLRGQPLPHSLRYFVVEQVNYQAMAQYRAEPCSVSACLFRTLHSHRQDRRDDSLGWSALATGGVQVIRLQGEHASFVEEPALASTFAEFIRSRQPAEVIDLADARLRKEI
ncbi:non-ribosomal peptide synthetase/type I polyketide synthase [Pseudomarimonas arenosa]|uniref:Amino acid adenylation domain-containing protein n=1 Tax=Pseudomarimonas arenosa TaxID=2774145 RepID=A0AAW3ZKM0_9GAMM|nr:non-ribosomal peptide synthetase/type I polyketide synthase [Pseudomarimonas arenosa]MBD8524856.1 amino acid adenylation domain-containing protein [Pseudomarimonas arenosa]